MMGKFEYGLIGVMAFLILGILGMIAISPDSNTIEIKESMAGLGTTSEPESGIEPQHSGNNGLRFTNTLQRVTIPEERAYVFAEKFTIKVWILQSEDLV